MTLRAGTVLLLAALLGAGPRAALAQTPAPGPFPGPLAEPPQDHGPVHPGDTVWATPRQRYDASLLQRWIMGNGHRELWAVPVRAPVLDLATFEGGLAPERLGGGFQTRSLRFRDAAGRTWVFRSLDKDASRTLDPVLRQTLAAWAVQDRVSSLLPLGALVVSPLLDAAGVLHARPRLVVLPDDPALGTFREAFAGLLGWIEERPDEADDPRASFGGAARVVGSERMLERLDEGPDNAVDARAYLRARLLDFLVGDWDRHPDQWRWAGYPRDDGGLRFEPVPRDRDWAFSRLDGLLPRITAVSWPHYVSFGDRYPAIVRLSWGGRALDRRILPVLERRVFDQEARALAAALDDAVIADAVGRLPDPYRTRVGPWLDEALRARRDALPDVALRFHDLLADWLDLHATDRPEVARVRRLSGGDLEVTVADAERPDAPWLRRRVDGRYTREVRLYMAGGDDRVLVEGDGDEPGGRPGPILRVVGGDGDDRLEDRSDGRGVSFHDADPGDRLVPGRHTRVDRTPWREPFDPATAPHGAPARNWGSRWVPTARAETGPDVGLLVGVGARRTAWGFRSWPFTTRFDAWAGLATATRRPVASAALAATVAPDVRATLEATSRGGRLAFFHGFGNATPGGEPDGRWEVTRRDVEVAVGTRFRPDGGLSAGAALEARFLGAEEGEGSLLREAEPYGSGTFRQIGLTAGVGVRGGSPSGSGSWPALLTGDVEGRWYPGILEVGSAFGGLAVHGSALRDLPLPLDPRLTLRARGERVWGPVPWHEAATLGGAETLRGDPAGRWAGDAALAGGADLELALGEVPLVLPARVGLLLLADAGRVFVDGESPGGWHRAAGGGVWAEFLDSWTLRAALVRGERTRFYVNGRITPDAAP